MAIAAATIISDELNKEMKKISIETGKRLSFLYREAIQEYVERHKVITIEQPA
jgi:hypothetical protein